MQAQLNPRAVRPSSPGQSIRRPPPVQQREDGREIPAWEITLGKTIFYLTVALSLWFFYWLNGIQCPC